MGVQHHFDNISKILWHCGHLYWWRKLE